MRGRPFEFSSRLRREINSVRIVHSKLVGSPSHLYNDLEPRPLQDFTRRASPPSGCSCLGQLLFDALPADITARLDPGMIFDLQSLFSSDVVQRFLKHPLTCALLNHEVTILRNLEPEILLLWARKAFCVLLDISARVIQDMTAHTSSSPSLPGPPVLSATQAHSAPATVQIPDMRWGMDRYHSWLPITTSDRLAFSTRSPDAASRGELNDGDGSVESASAISVPWQMPRASFNSMEQLGKAALRIPLSAGINPHHAPEEPPADVRQWQEQQLAQLVETTKDTNYVPSKSQMSWRRYK